MSLRLAPGLVSLEAVIRPAFTEIKVKLTELRIGSLLYHDRTMIAFGALPQEDNNHNSAPRTTD